MTRPQIRVFVLCAVLTCLAAVPRFYRLDALSFYGDEDLTALAASSLHAGPVARLPSGLEYRRALPYTWLVAASARWFGERSEAAYRLPSALLGTLAVPLLFLFGRWLIGGRAALIAVLLLMFSEWDLATTRQARMYGPLLFFVLAAIFAVLAWSRTGKARYAVMALPPLAIAATLHLTAVFAAVFAILALLVSGWSRVRPALLATLAAAAVAGTLAWEYWFVASAYRGWVLPRARGADSPDRLLDPITAQPWFALLAATGAALAVWAVLRARPPGPRVESTLQTIAQLGSAAVAGALAAAGQLYGASLALAVFLLLQPSPLRAWSRRVALPVALLALAAAAGSFLTLLRGDHDLAKGWRALVAFPRPYALMLAEQMPAVCLLFTLGIVLLARRRLGDQERALRIIGLGALCALAALGLSQHGAHIRYAFAIYPLLLLVAAWSLLILADLPRRWLPGWSATHAWLLAAVVAVSGMVGGHGLGIAIQQAQLQHGEPIAERPNQFPFRPDHKSAGQYVRRMRGPHDVVIAEDASMQHWYAGRVDYWFRRYGDARAYLYASRDGKPRESYTGSLIAAEPHIVDSIVAATRHRVWLITSGETAPLHAWYLSPAQSRWLDSVARARRPAFVALDTVTRVYCLNCGLQLRERQPHR